MAFPLPTALLERLRLVREGAQVLIQYAGRSFKEFEVFVAEEGTWTEGAEHPEPPMTRVPSAEG